MVHRTSRFTIHRPLSFEVKEKTMQEQASPTTSRPPGCEAVESSIRFFKRMDKGKKRHGIWIMDTSKKQRGEFIHGDRDEMQGPRYSLAELSKWSAEGGPISVMEISKREAVEELGGTWPEAVEFIKALG